MISEADLDEYRANYPPWITVEQAAAIAGVPRGTLYDWSSNRLFDGFKAKRGRRIRLHRDSFIRFLVGGAGPSRSGPKPPVVPDPANPF